MPNYEFLVETVYEEVVEIEAESLEDAEELVLKGEGSQIDMVRSANVIQYREIDSGI